MPVIFDEIGFPILDEAGFPILDELGGSIGASSSPSVMLDAITVAAVIGPARPTQPQPVPVAAVPPRVRVPATVGGTGTMSSSQVTRKAAAVPTVS